MNRLLTPDITDALGRRLPAVVHVPAQHAGLQADPARHRRALDRRSRRERTRRIRGAESAPPPPPNTITNSIPRVPRSIGRWTTCASRRSTSAPSCWRRHARPSNRNCRRRPRACSRNRRGARRAGSRRVEPGRRDRVARTRPGFPEQRARDFEMLTTFRAACELMRKLRTASVRSGVADRSAAASARVERGRSTRRPSRGGEHCRSRRSEHAADRAHDRASAE